MLRILLAVLFIIIFPACQSTEISGTVLEEADGLHGQEAEDIYSKALAETDAEEIYYNLAYSHLQQQEWTEAAAVADEALAIYPDMIRFMYLKAYAFREAGMMRSYEETLRGILDKDPGNTAIRAMLARRYQATGRDSWAEDEARTILRYDHENAEAIAVLARYSDFFRAIDASSSAEEPRPEWNQPPQLYDPLRILAGEGLISQP